MENNKNSSKNKADQAKLNSSLFLLILFFVALLAFGYVAYVRWIQDHAYSVEASTELFALNTGHPTLNEWDVSGMALYDEKALDSGLAGQGGKCEPLSHEAVLKIANGVHVDVNRIGSNGTLKIQLSRKPANDVSPGTSAEEKGESSLGELSLSNSQGEIKTQLLKDSYVMFKVCPRQAGSPPLTLPFGGTVTLGDDVAPFVQAVMLEGKVTIISKTPFKEVGYINTSEPLGLGDRLKLYIKDTKEHEAEMAGFVRVDNGKPMTLVYHGIADRAEVVRLGRANYEISPSLLAILENDPVIHFIAALFAFFFGIFETRKKLREAFSKECK